MDPETGCEYDFQLPLSSERPSIYQATMWVGSTGSATRYPNPAISRMQWASRRRVDTRRIPFLTGMSICPALPTSYPSLRPPGIIPPIDSPALEEFTDRRLSASQGLPDMDAFKALRKLHIRDCRCFLPQLGRMYATRKSANRAVTDANPSVTQRQHDDTRLLDPTRPPALTLMVRLQSACDTLPA
jgi:hypothetical protein